MKVSMTVLPNSKEQAEEILAFFQGLEDGESEGDEEEAPPKKTGKKKPKVEEEDSDEDESDDGETEGDEEESSSEFSEDDVRKACKLHAQKHTHAKTLLILKKYKAKKVADIDESDYEAVMADLKKKVK